jgi:hypothetical protein
MVRSVKPTKTRLMNRIIKFRAWDEKKKEFVWDFSLDARGDVRTAHTGLGYEALHETKVHLMQFTGLKDKSGKDIYEGDIVRDWENIDRYKVVWNDHWACFELERITHANDTTEEIDRASFDLEIIGNIYETPELLK